MLTQWLAPVPVSAQSQENGIHFSVLIFGQALAKTHPEELCPPPPKEALFTFWAHCLPIDPFEPDTGHFICIWHDWQHDCWLQRLIGGKHNCWHDSKRVHRQLDTVANDKSWTVTYAEVASNKRMNTEQFQLATVLLLLLMEAVQWRLFSWRNSGTRIR